MNALQALEYLSRNGMELLRECLALDAYQLAALGMPLQKAKDYMRAAEAYLGPADSSRIQRETVELAAHMGHSVEHLVMINRHARQLKQRGAGWKLRAELVAMTGSYEEVNKAGGARVKEINGPKASTPGVKFSRTREGLRTITITDDQRAVTDLEKTLDAVTQEQGFQGERRETLRQSWWTHLHSGASTVRPAYQTVIAIGLEDSMRVLRGEGDDVVVGLSDGTTMTGAELVAAAIAGELGSDIMAGLFHPSTGPVNLYEARFASAKQRILAKAENLVCPWPDCGVPADRCQIHHIDAHKHGGQTEPSNLTMLCSYHNGVNDDDPEGRGRQGQPGGPGGGESPGEAGEPGETGTPGGAGSPGDAGGPDSSRGERKRRQRERRGFRGRKRSRGRVDRHRGRVRYRSPSGKLIANDHDNANLGAMSLIGVP